jgi:peroxiredoxin
MPTSFGGQSQQRWGDNTLNQSEFMRDVQMMDTSGKVCSTTDARKKGMILLAFFRADDAACEPVLTALQTLADAYKESGKLTVWAVSQSGEAESVAFAQRLGVKFPILLDRDLYHSMTYGLTTVPTVYFADAAGVVQRKLAAFSRAGLNDISARVASVAGVDAVDLFAPPAAAPSPVAIEA